MSGNHHAALNGPIGVLCGGPSGEREISLRSGAAVHEALAAQGLPAVLVPLAQDQEQIPEQLRRAKLSCAFVVLHGPFGEDGAIQALLDEMRVPYTGSTVESSRRAMDKITSRQAWAAAKLPIPRWVEAPLPFVLSSSRHERIGFPLIVKPGCQGSSLGISLVDDPQQLPAAVEEAARYGDQVLLEEYLPGPEITIGILQDRPLPVVQVVPKRRFYDYVAKYTPGMTEYLVPAPVPEEAARSAQETALKAHQVLGCRSFSRVDMILARDRGPVLLEINTIPGMTQLSLLPKAAAAAGISFQELCRRMLLSAVE